MCMVAAAADYEAGPAAWDAARNAEALVGWLATAEAKQTRNTVNETGLQRLPLERNPT